MKLLENPSCARLARFGIFEPTWEIQRIDDSQSGVGTFQGDHLNE